MKIDPAHVSVVLHLMFEHFISIAFLECYKKTMKEYFGKEKYNSLITMILNLCNRVFFPRWT